MSKVLLGLSLAEWSEKKTITMMVLRMKNHTTAVIVVKGRGMENVKEARKTGVIRGLPSGLTVLESSPHPHSLPNPPFSYHVSVAPLLYCWREAGLDGDR